MAAPNDKDIELVDFAAPAPLTDDLAAKFKEHSQRFVLLPLQWKTWTHFPPLTWTIVEFSEKGHESVPAERGIYCFVARPRALGLPAIGFPLYVGETGDKSKATLSSRFGQYLAEAQTGKRAKIKFWCSRLSGLS